GAAAEDAGDAGVFERLALLFERLTERLQQLGRGKGTFDVVPGRENRDRLVDAMLFVGFQVLHPALFDELDDPPRIQIDAKADTAAELSQVLDGQSQPPRAAGAEHEPVGALGKILFGQCAGEYLVVGPVVLDDHTTLRNAGGAARFEDVRWLACEGFGNPATGRPAAKPFVLEEWKLLNVRVALHFLEWVEFQLALLAQPKRTAGRFVKVMLNDFVGVLIELILGSIHARIEFRRRDNFR